VSNRLPLPVRWQAARLERAFVAIAIVGLGLAIYAMPTAARLDVEPVQQVGQPGTRRATYVVSAKVRPLVLFWIGRDDVGSASITWRTGPSEQKAIEFVIGTDPERAPRRINRWGFIVEHVGDGRANILGVMKESRERTLDEAEAQVARQDPQSVFRAARTTITGVQVVTHTMSLRAPSDLTYQERDQLVARMEAAPATVRRRELPPGTHPGFLVAMDTLIDSSLESCTDGGGAKAVPRTAYVYNQTVYDLELVDCSFDARVHTKVGSFADVVEGTFRLQNRSTHDHTRFTLSYGTSGEVRGIPVRAVFRPRWWMEVEMVLNRPADGRDGVDQSRELPQ
jgi:hypothetical protein